MSFIRGIIVGGTNLRCRLSDEICSAGGTAFLRTTLPSDQASRFRINIHAGADLVGISVAHGEMNSARLSNAAAQLEAVPLQRLTLDVFHQHAELLRMDQAPRQAPRRIFKVRRNLLAHIFSRFHTFQISKVCDGEMDAGSFNALRRRFFSRRTARPREESGRR